MPTLKSFEEIESWQKARELTRGGLHGFESRCLYKRFLLT